MINILKSLYSKIINHLGNNLNKREKEIKQKINICKAMLVKPYSSDAILITCTTDIIEAIMFLSVFNKIDIHKDIYRPPDIYNNDLQFCIWFTSKDRLLSEPNNIWYHMLEEYEILVSRYFKHINSEVALAVTNATRVQPLLFNMEKFLDNVINIYNKDVSYL